MTLGGRKNDTEDKGNYISYGNGALILMEMISVVRMMMMRKRKYETEPSTCGNGDTGAGSFLSVSIGTQQCSDCLCTIDIK